MAYERCSNKRSRSPAHLWRPLFTDGDTPWNRAATRLRVCMPRRQLFGDDEAVKKGLLQVFVRVKPVPRKLARCMTMERQGLVKAIW